MRAGEELVPGDGEGDAVGAGVIGFLRHGETRGAEVRTSPAAIGEVDPVVKAARGGAVRAGADPEGVGIEERWVLVSVWQIAREGGAGEERGSAGREWTVEVGRVVDDEDGAMRGGQVQQPTAWVREQWGGHVPRDWH